MSLKVKLTLEKSEILFQEDTACEVTITNIGQAPVEVLFPSNSYKMPVFKVVDAETGVETTAQRKPSLFVREMYHPLAPGKTEKGTLNLSQVVKFEKPGVYDISCVWEWNKGAGRAASEPVRLTVRGVKPKSAHFVTLNGGPATSQVGAWVNLGATPPALTLTYLDLGRKPRVVNTRVLGPIAAGAQPVISTPPNGTLAQGMWLAWFEGDKLQIARTAENDKNPPTMTQLQLAPLPKSIVAPLNWLSGPRGPEGKFYLWQGNNEGTISRFQTVHLDSRGNAEAGANAILTGSQPVWTHAAFLSNMTSRTYALTQDAAGVTLQGATWSEKNEADKARSFATWPGDFIAAGLTLAANNDVFGALLVLEPGPENSRRLLLHSWRHDAAGEFDEGVEEDLQRQPSEKVARAVVAAGIHGEPAALVLIQGGMWEFYRSETGRRAVMDPKSIGDGPVNIVFPNSTDPLIQYSDAAMGFHFLTFKGMPALGPISG